jgi:hypothetical protein
MSRKQLTLQLQDLAHEESWQQAVVHAAPHDVSKRVIAKTVSIVMREPELNTTFAVR